MQQPLQLQLYFAKHFSDRFQTDFLSEEVSLVFAWHLDQKAQKHKALP